jgi:hypothetical protein
MLNSKYGNMFDVPITVAAPAKAWVCGRSLAGIAGSNLPGEMDVFRECLCRLVEVSELG